MKDPKDLYRPRDPLDMDESELVETPPPPLEIKGFVTAGPGWNAWFIRRSRDRSAVSVVSHPLAGWATVRDRTTDRIVPMILDGARGFQLTDPRLRKTFLLITTPAEERTALEYATSYTHDWGRWPVWRAKHPCQCTSPNGHVCRPNETEPHDGCCGCECHAIAAGTKPWPEEAVPAAEGAG